MATTNKQPPSNIGPRALIALAKDERYVEAFRKILSKLMEVQGCTRHSTTAACLLSAAIYTWLMLIKSGGRTLGMEAAGLSVLHNRSSRAFSTAVVLSVATCAVTTSCFSAMTQQIPELHLLQVTPIWIGVNDALRGSDRLAAFAEQRREMIRRAQQLQQDERIPKPDKQGAIRGPELRTTWQGLCRTLMRRLQLIGFDAVSSIYQALRSCSASGGPHDLPYNTSNNNTVGERRRTIGSWILRLRLAYFCLGGEEILFGRLNHDRKLGDRLQSPLPEKRMVRLLGLLILAHAAGTAVRTIATSILRHFAARSMHNGAGNEDPDNDGHGAQSTRNEPAGANDKEVTCAICQERRTNPACSVRCGHVFCWKCWQLCLQRGQKKMECPVCRAPCQPQDVLPLLDYFPSGNFSETIN